MCISQKFHFLNTYFKNHLFFCTRKFLSEKPLNILASYFGDSSFFSYFLFFEPVGRGQVKQSVELLLERVRQKSLKLVSASETVSPVSSY